MSVNIDHSTNTVTTDDERIILDVSGDMVLPKGTTAERTGSPDEGSFRYNSDSKNMEFYNGTSWITVDPDLSLIYAIIFGG